MNEKVKITLDGKAEQEFFDEVLKANNFAVKSNEMQELKSAVGTAAYVVRASGVSVDKETGNVTNGNGASLKIDYVTAPNIFPLSWENGIVKECAFSSAVVDKDATYTYLQIHHLDDSGDYIIENKLYQNTTETELSKVKSLENVPPVVHTGSKTPQFVIDRLAVQRHLRYVRLFAVEWFEGSMDEHRRVRELDAVNDEITDIWRKLPVEQRKPIEDRRQRTRNADDETALKEARALLEEVKALYLREGEQHG